MLNQAQRADLQYILQESVINATSPSDELALLRVALRAWMEGKRAPEAVRWAAEQLANSIAST